MFLKNIFSFIQSDYVVTFAMCVLASLGVAIIMRFFVKTAFIKLDEYFKSRGKDDKFLAIYNTCKAIAYLVIAGVLTIIALSKLMNVCVFPAENSRALSIFYFLPMFALQFFLDKHMKKIACHLFGIEYEKDDEEKEEKPVKEKKPKVHYKKVAYTLDDEGNEVPVEV